MSYCEMDVAEVLDGFPPPSGMTKASKVEVVRRLAERAARRGEPIPAHPVLAARLRVTVRTIERYRRELRDASLS